MEQKRFIKVAFIVGWHHDQDAMGNDYETAEESAVILPFTPRGIEVALRGIRRAFSHGLADSAGVTEIEAHGLGAAAYFERDGGMYYNTLDELIEHHRRYLQSYADWSHQFDFDGS